MKKKLLPLILLLATALFAQAQSISVVCFNIRYDNPADGEFAWEKRRSAVVGMLLEEKPQVIGLQEVLERQLNFLDAELKDYKTIGVGREDGKTGGEYSPLLYDAKSLRVVDSGYFWLSETPEQPSMGWDAACRRIATWAVFEQVEGGKRFIAINTHFDHVGKTARAESGKLMLSKIEELTGGLPAVIMGDFNAEIGDDSLEPLRENTTEVRGSNKEFAKQPAYTFIGFDPSVKKSLIDHIFVKGFEAEDYRVITRSYGIKQLSDHLPVAVRLRFTR